MKRDYLSRLARWARWYLPPAEAAEVLEDYREIAGVRTDEELERDLGKPWRVARQLVQPKAYRRWLAVFLGLVLCGGLPVVMTLDYDFWRRYANLAQVLFLILSIALSTLWFRQNGKREVAQPKAVFWLLALPLAGMAWAWAIAWAVLTESWTVFLNAIIPTTIVEIEQMQHPSLVEIAQAMHVSLVGGALTMGALAAFALVRARLGDRRWLAVYVSGLAGMMLLLSVRAILTSMGLPFPPEEVMWLWLRYVLITLVGFVGTAVSLC